MLLAYAWRSDGYWPPCLASHLLDNPCRAIKVLSLPFPGKCMLPEFKTRGLSSKFITLFSKTNKSRWGLLVIRDASERDRGYGGCLSFSSQISHLLPFPCSSIWKGGCICGAVSFSSNTHKYFPYAANRTLDSVFHPEDIIHFETTQLQFRLYVWYLSSLSSVAKVGQHIGRRTFIHFVEEESVHKANFQRLRGGGC